VEGNKEPVVLDDSGEEQPAERPAQPKSGAAAAAAIAAAKADVAAREAVRRTWKDPCAAAREQADASKAPEASHAAAANGHAARDDRVVNGSSKDEVLEGAGEGKVPVLGSKGGAAVGNGNGAMKRKRTRSGMIVDCEEI
jgi:hypothetical protein